MRWTVLLAVWTCCSVSLATQIGEVINTVGRERLLDVSGRAFREWVTTERAMGRSFVGSYYGQTFVAPWQSLEAVEFSIGRSPNAALEYQNTARFEVIVTPVDVVSEYVPVLDIYEFDHKPRIADVLFRSEVFEIPFEQEHTDIVVDFDGLQLKGGELYVVLLDSTRTLDGKKDSIILPIVQDGYMAGNAITTLGQVGCSTAPFSGCSWSNLNGNLVSSGLNADMEMRLTHATLPGDSNADGVFSQLDLVKALQGGKYLTQETATWSEGDWNLDGLFNQHDIIATLPGYSTTTVAALSVPEPSTLRHIVVAALIAVTIYVVGSWGIGRPEEPEDPEEGTCDHAWKDEV